MINTEVMTNNTVLKDTIDMLFDLSVDDLLEIQSFIKGNRSRNMKDAAADIAEFYKPLTEAELIERIDKGIAEADAGMFIDSETMEKELIAEFGL
ncbi:MAG: hypothetical protein II969_01860 [Anaerolineaceae bacterium]|nr:hypothetical protein [Anaerolineaceae bacterium]